MEHSKPKFFKTVMKQKNLRKLCFTKILLTIIVCVSLIHAIKKIIHSEVLKTWNMVPTEWKPCKILCELIKFTQYHIFWW